MFLDVSHRGIGILRSKRRRNLEDTESKALPSSGGRGVVFCSFSGRFFIEWMRTGHVGGQATCASWWYVRTYGDGAMGYARPCRFCGPRACEGSFYPRSRRLNHGNGSGPTLPREYRQKNHQHGGSRGGRSLFPRTGHGIRLLGRVLAVGHAMACWRLLSISRWRPTQIGCTLSRRIVNCGDGSQGWIHPSGQVVVVGVSDRER